MESNNGSQEPQPEPMHPLEERALRSRRQPESPADLETHLSQEPLSDWGPQKRARLERLRTVNRSPSLTREEQDRIADGEPYCFRCGRPASSFSEYVYGASDSGLTNAWQYVIEEEGTYNDDTNRFACDECYIAIGAPSTNTIEGWKAP